MASKNVTYSINSQTERMIEELSSEDGLNDTKSRIIRVAIEMLYNEFFNKAK